MISGILSIILLLILWWNVIYSCNNESILPSLPDALHHFNKRNDIEEAITLNKNRFIKRSETSNSLQISNNTELNTIIMSKWLRNIAIPSVLVMVSTIVVFVTISLTSVTKVPTYMYITYFKDHNFTVTIQVSHNYLNTSGLYIIVYFSVVRNCSIG